MADLIQIRRDTAANWTSVNPTLAQGELGIELDTNQLKVGDGATAWTALPYFGGAGDYADAIHAHAISDVTGLQDALDGKATAAQGVLADSAMQPVSLVCDGPVASGAPVALTPTGKATAISGAANTTSSIGAIADVLGTGTSATLAAAWSEEEQVGCIVFKDYEDPSYAITYVCYTVAGTTVTYGTPAHVLAATDNSNVESLVWDAKNSIFVLLVREPTVFTVSIFAGTVSGTMITWGTKLNLSGRSSPMGLAVTGPETVFVYSDTAHDDIFASVLTFSGTTVTNNNEQLLFSNEHAGANYSVSVEYDSATSGGYFLAWKGTSNIRYCYLTVSGNIVSAGAVISGVASGDGGITGAYNPTTSEFCIVFPDADGAVSQIVTASGGVVTAYTPDIFASYASWYAQIWYNPSADSFVFGVTTSTTMYLLVGTDTIDLGATTDSYWLIADYESKFSDAGNLVLVGRRNIASPKFIRAQVVNIETTVLTNANKFIGFAQNSALDSETVTVKTKYQIDENQTGLTPDSVYYLNVDGTLNIGNTGQPVAGYAFTATKLRVGG